MDRIGSKQSGHIRELTKWTKMDNNVSDKRETTAAPTTEGEREREGYGTGERERKKL